ncbi:alpha/beta hydrolase family protein [Polaribacter septentrionalilitoris]|uniref:alpha/beta hydrolase family protein n=1 Tax=Polaribacter septentrionalilitoris TaxID=2494657 RepID=UPI001359FBFF|nr:alpha/beta hydrolase [Polaribacter septentrionalilitoris]
MNRVILYLAFYITGVTITIGQVKSEEILIKNNTIELPGTLTYLEPNKPLIIWVHGSGGVDRNGNQSKYIQQFREAINKHNIAFFSYDKRTTNPKNASILKKNGVVFSDFIDDVKKAVYYFKDDERFSEIILVGHSQGSLVAMLALDNVDKYISIAGAGETIDKILIRQITRQNPIYGAITEKYLNELKETGAIKEVDPNLMSLFAKQNQPFLISWIQLNPLKIIKKVTVPTLIVNGDKDFQVLVKDAENLKVAKPEAQLVIIKNLNHVLKHIDKDKNNLNSYLSPDFPISKQLIKTVTNFIQKTKN